MSNPTDERVREIAAEFASVAGGLMPALHAIQHEMGWIVPGTAGVLADVFNLSAAEVHGVITFYKDFRTTEPIGPIVQVCRAEACQAVGADAVMDRARQLAGSAGVEIEEVFCLGNCALGPSICIGGTVTGRVEPARLPHLLGQASTPTPEPVRGGTGVKVYVPMDSAAVAAGAEDVAAALAAHGGVEIVRTGSRGMLWIEPLIEVETPEGRVGYGPMHPADVAGWIAAGGLSGADHDLYRGPIDEIPWLVRQQRITFARVGVVDPRSLADYEAHGGLVGLRRALSMTPAEIVAEVATSGLRGRGGAAFPTGIKWQTVHDAPGDQKYICCNADEGDSGTFADRMLMEGDPFTLIEGMTIAGLAVGATQGYIYLRSEYPAAITAMNAAIAAATSAGWLGESVHGSGRAFHLEVRVGAGAYICGEETAMLESLEGRRGVVRAKPPLPALEGLFGKPTVVNNVLSLATVPMILAEGGPAYQALGIGRSRGTKVFQLAGNIAQGGIVESAFGITLGELVDGFGAGTRSGLPVKAVQVGGPLGSYLPRDRFDLPMDYEAFAAADALVGHGGIVVFDDTVDMAAQARFAMEFCAAESCGKCTPCRIGSTRGVEVIDKIRRGDDRETNLVLLEELCEVMADGSLCAMGGLTPMPVRSALTHFAPDFHRTPEGLS